MTRSDARFLAALFIVSGVLAAVWGLIFLVRKVRASGGLAGGPDRPWGTPSWTPRSPGGRFHATGAESGAGPMGGPGAHAGPGGANPAGSPEAGRAAGAGPEGTPPPPPSGGPAKPRRADPYGVHGAASGLGRAAAAAEKAADQAASAVEKALKHAAGAVERAFGGTSWKQRKAGPGTPPPPPSATEPNAGPASPTGAAPSPPPPKRTLWDLPLVPEKAPAAGASPPPPSSAPPPPPAPLPPEELGPIAPAVAEAALAAEGWHVAKDGAVYGPLTLAQLRERLRTLGPRTPVWAPGFRTWAPASAVPALLPS